MPDLVQPTVVTSPVAPEGAGAVAPPPQGARYESANSPEAQQARAAAAPPPVVAPVIDDEEDETPPPAAATGANGQKLEGDALKARLDRERERERKRLLREHYGTDDPQEVSRLKAAREEESKEFARLRRVEDARKRARMTDAQRIQKENEAKEAELQKLREELQQERQGHVIEKQNHVITAAAGKHVAPESQDFALFKLKQHVKELQEDPKKLRLFSSKLDKSLDRWFGDFAKQYPQHAIAVTTTEPVKPEEPVVAKPVVVPRRRPITTGNPPATKTPAPKDGPGQVAGKTVKPGQNQMSKSELAEVYKQRGMKLPY